MRWTTFLNYERTTVTDRYIIKLAIVFRIFTCNSFKTFVYFWIQESDIAIAAIISPISNMLETKEIAVYKYSRRLDFMSKQSYLFIMTHRNEAK